MPLFLEACTNIRFTVFIIGDEGMEDEINYFDFFSEHTHVFDLGQVPWEKLRLFECCEDETEVLFGFNQSENTIYLLAQR